MTGYATTKNLITVNGMLSTLAVLTLTFMSAAPPGDCPTSRESRLPTVRFANSVLVGRHVKDARSCATQLGWKFRVVRRDGCSRVITLDRRTDRVNVTVYQGQVIYVYVG